jgi:hypothetical protein
MNKTVGVGVLCLFLYLSFAGLAFAQVTVAGVSKADKFSYKCVLLGSHNQSSYWPDWVPERNQSSWYVTVVDINNSRISYDLEILLVNGTKESFLTQYLDLFSGGSNGQNYLFFVPANVNSGVRVYPGSDTYFVNDTVTRNYASGQRETNHVVFSSAAAQWNEYFDRQTGVMVELSETSVDGNGTFSLKLTDSSIWLVSITSASPSTSPSTSASISPSTSSSPSPSASASPTNASPSPSIPEFPLAAISLLVMIAVLIAIVVSKKHKVRVAQRSRTLRFLEANR